MFVNNFRACPVINKNGNSLYIYYKLPSKHGKVIFLHKTYALDLFSIMEAGQRLMFVGTRFYLISWVF